MAQKIALLAAVAVVLAGAPVASAQPTVNGDSGVVAEINATMASVAAEFPMTFYGVTLATDWLAEDTYAQTDGYTVWFNRRWTSDPTGWQAAYDTDVAQGFHPPGCSAARGTALHEAAHVVSLRTGQLPELLVAQHIKDGTLNPGQLSGYGRSDLHEAVAESFVSVECNPLGATMAEHLVYSVLVTVSR